MLATVSAEIQLTITQGRQQRLKFWVLWFNSEQRHLFTVPMGLLGLDKALEASAPGGGGGAEKEYGCARWRLSRLILEEEPC